MCSRCAQLQERVDELENILFPGLDSASATVCRKLGVAPAHGKIITALYALPDGGGLNHVELDALVPLSDNPSAKARRIDPEFRTMNTIKQWLFQIRERLGADFIESRRCSGVWLSARGREAVRQVLGE